MALCNSTNAVRFFICTHNELAPNRNTTARELYLISDALPFARLWYGEPKAISNAIGYPKFYSRSHHAVIRVYDAAGNVIETHEPMQASSNG